MLNGFSLQIKNNKLRNVFITAGKGEMGSK